MTGTRADFGKIKPLIAALNEAKRFETHIFATSMHLNSVYGYTVNEIEKCGFPNIYKFINHTDYYSLDAALGNTIRGFGDYIKTVHPDLIVVHGDRVEALAGALAGSLNNILVAHIEGGEISGTIDEHIRHAVSKLSHLHFVANEGAKKRLMQMGEAEDAVFIIGSPDIDIMNSETLPSLEESKKRYSIPFTEYAILVFHPVTTEPDTLQRSINILIDVLVESGKNYVAIYPNNDPGTEIILEAYQIRLRNNSHFAVYPSLRFEHFLTLLKNTRFIIGNSSSGVREAPYYGVPSINVGTRQNGRNRALAVPNVFHCGYDKNEILAAMQKYASGPVRFKPTRLFGDGRSTEKFLAIICQEKIWSMNVQKQFMDIDF